MARDHDIYWLNPTRFFVGLSAVIGVSVVAGLNAVVLKNFGGGSLELVDGTTASPWGLGYLFGSNEVLQMDHAGSIFLAATGATATVMMIRGKSTGFEA